MTSQTKDSPQTNGKTKFEKDLQAYFPDLYKFWSMVRFDAHAERVMKAMLAMMNDDGYGTIRITYQRGKINRVLQEIDVTANKKERQHY